jgi:prepilin-type N-terminal cleavage/methylation domain-containing protein
VPIVGGNRSRRVVSPTARRPCCLAISCTAYGDVQCMGTAGAPRGRVTCSHGRRAACGAAPKGGDLDRRSLDYQQRDRRVDVPSVEGGLRLRSLLWPGTRNRARGTAFSRRRRDGGADEGFTLIEVVVAVSLLTILLVGLAREGIESLSASNYANQRSVAASLISGAIAEVQALPFADVDAGLNPSVDTLTNDPNITKSGSTYTFTKGASPWATLATSNTNTSEAPLVPHIATVKEGITYKVAVYPTVNSSMPGLVTVTVVVTWTSPNIGTASMSGVTQVAAP